MVRGKRDSSALLRVLLAFLLLITPVRVFAGVDSVTDIGKSQTMVAHICNQANSSVGIKTSSSKKILSYNSKTGLLSFSNSNYSTLDTEEKRTFMETALQATRETSLGSQVQLKVYNFIADQDSTTSSAIRFLKSDASADFVEAQNWFRPFSGVFGMILGLLCLFIFMFLGLSFVWDMAYLCLPTAKALFERGKPHERPFGVSREAWASAKDSEKELSYRNVLSIYFQRRTGQIIVMCITLGYVISGRVYDIIVFFIDAFTL